MNKQYNSSLFFWFFPAEQGYETAPLLVWLQGGPGSTSLYGLFTELGPFFVGEDHKSLVKNPYSWHKNHSIIFIDNPVGTGFSFTDQQDGYAKEQVQVGAELYSAILQFLTVFPELQAVPFFITGESYAGKYVPAFAYTIHQNNPTAELKINLHGIAVGNGFTDPITILDYSHFLYQLGLVDTNTYNEMKDIEKSGKTAIQEGRLVDAFWSWSYDLDVFMVTSEFWNLYNLLYEVEPEVGGDLYTFVQLPEVRRALHVGDQAFASGGTVYEYMIPDFMNSVRPWLEEVIENYRVLYYSGQMDIIVAYPLTVGLFNTLEFTAAAEYRAAERIPWYVDGRLAGYMKSGGNFTEVVVRNAGHMVPTDQPLWAFDLINRFTQNDLLPRHK